MLTVQLRLIISFLGQQIVEEVTAAANETLGAVLRAVLMRDGLPLSGTRWMVRHQGRPLRADETVGQAFPGASAGQTFVLEVAGEAVPTAPAAQPGAPVAAPAAPAPVPQPPPPPRAPVPPTFPTPPSAGLPSPPPAGTPGGMGPGYEIPVLRKARGPRYDELPDEEDFDEPLMEDMDDEDSGAEQEAAPEKARSSTKTRTKARVDRHTTVRHYSRMNPQRVYPLLVVISERSVLEVVQAGVVQAQSRKFRVELGSDVEIEPILPGCACYPEKQTVRVGAGEAIATFHVSPQAFGSLPGARVVVRQGVHVLAEVPLRMKVVQHTLTRIMGLATLVLPAGQALLKHYGFDFESLLQNGLGDHAALGQEILDFLSPLRLALILAALTLLLYLWFRPRRRNVFFDLSPVGPEEAFRLGLQAIQVGDDKRGVRMISDLTKTHPDFQPAWQFCAYWYHDHRRPREAMPCYEKVLKMGKADARVYLRAASTAGRLGQPARGLAILKDAQQAHNESKHIASIWYHMACFAAQMNNGDEAMLYLVRAVKCGFNKVAATHKERALDSLRMRPDFQELVLQLS